MNNHRVQTFPFNHHPAQLWLGSIQAVAPLVEHVLQKQFCANDGCTYCTECYKIRTRQHHGLMWIAPEKLYTRELISPILEVLQFKRATDEPFFFVLQDADFLTDSCANALLKSLEEPPFGYYFILIASRKQMVLPTVRSRCIIQQIEHDDTVTNHQPLFDHFSHIKPQLPVPFLQLLEKSDINEKDSVELIDALLAYWHSQMRTAIQQDDQEAYKHATRTMHILTKIAEKPPMPGSAKLFWKNLFLHI